MNKHELENKVCNLKSKIELNLVYCSVVKSHKDLHTDARNVAVTAIELVTNANKEVIAQAYAPTNGADITRRYVWTCIEESF